ncbi:hypothetical protein [Campylobacter rectus]|uniref:hypothetical protein n=1 Tax=Campylobacter rectus TaxID=203 RepID=UPI00163A4A95|nr:hypothetical protein [Campylobacter rectus]
MRKVLNLGFKSEFIDENAAELSEILRSILAVQAPRAAKRPPHRHLHQRKRRRERANRKGKRAAKKFIKNERLEIYDKPGGFNRTYFARKQRQLYLSMLENKGFSRPSRFMWV